MGGSAARGSGPRSWRARGRGGIARSAKGPREHRLSAGYPGRPRGCGNQRVLEALQLSVQPGVICNPKVFSRFVAERKRVAPAGRPAGVSLCAASAEAGRGCHPPPAKHCLPQSEVEHLKRVGISRSPGVSCSGEITYTINSLCQRHFSSPCFSV